MEHMRLRALPTALRGPICFWALAGLALLLSHDAVFAAQIGPGEALTRALRTAGHDYWGLASMGLALVGATAALWAVARLLRLRRRARALQARPIDPTASFGVRFLVAWGRLFLVVAIGFAIQENLEHLEMHSHVIGAKALIGPEYPLALPVIGLITMVSAAIAALLTGAERALIATIVAALQRVVLRAPRRLHRPPLRIAEPRPLVLAGAAAGRAPPRLLRSAT
jgi:hypothetical protein